MSDSAPTPSQSAFIRRTNTLPSQYRDRLWSVARVFTDNWHIKMAFMLRLAHQRNEVELVLHEFEQHAESVLPTLKPELRRGEIPLGGKDTPTQVLFDDLCSSLFVPKDTLDVVEQLVREE